MNGSECESEYSENGICKRENKREFKDESVNESEYGKMEFISVKVRLLLATPGLQ